MLGNLCKVAVMAASIAASSIGVARAADQELPADVVAAAKKEGKVAFYTSFFGAKAHLDIIKSFRGQVRHQCRAARRARQRDDRTHPHRADRRSASSATWSRTARPASSARSARAICRSMAASPTPRICSRITRPNDFGVPTYILGYGILINKNAVKGDDEPKSWQDLKNPKWKGKIISDDPRALGGGNVMFSAFQDKLGEDFNVALSQQGLVLSRDVGNDERRVARGEFPMRIPQLFSNWLALKSLPVKFVAPAEGLPYIRFDFGVLNGAPHPNAARLFINHYLSEQVQTAYAVAGLMPMVDGILDKAGEAGAELKGIKLLGTTDVDRQDAMLDRAKQLYP